MTETELLALFLIGPGLFIKWWFVRHYRRGLASRNWPQVTGIVYQGASESEDGLIHYRYAIGEETYTGERDHVMADFLGGMGAKWFSTDKADLVHQDWVTVYYDPDDPSYSLITPGVRFKMLNIFLLGFSLFVIGAAFLLAEAPKELFS